MAQAFDSRSPSPRAVTTARFQAQILRLPRPARTGLVRHRVALCRLGTHAKRPWRWSAAQRRTPSTDRGWRCSFLERRHPWPDRAAPGSPRAWQGGAVMSTPVQKAARGIALLINQRPQAPSVEEIEAAIEYASASPLASRRLSLPSLPNFPASTTFAARWGIASSTKTNGRTGSTARPRPRAPSSTRSRP